MVNLGNDWDEILKNEFTKEYYQKLRKFLITEYKTEIIYPKMENIFSALKLTSYKDCKVLILLEIIIIQPAISKTDLGFGTIQEWES